MAGRHVAVPPPSAWGRKTLTIAAVVGVTASICGAAPAHASPQLLPTVTARPLPAQTIKPVPGSVAAPPVLRDPLAATSQADLAAARAAAVAAERVHQAAIAAVSSGPNPAAPFAPPASSRSGEAIVAYAEQYVGVVSYSTGASPAAGFECDGLVQWVYAAFGVHLPRGVTAQTGSGVQISRQDAVAGDLVVTRGNTSASTTVPVASSTPRTGAAKSPTAPSGAPPSTSTSPNQAPSEGQQP